MSDMYAHRMDGKGTPRHTHRHTVIRCAWCGMFGKEKRPGVYEHQEKPVTKHPFVAFEERVAYA